ncbi:hypothetical protein K438DRAFT_1040969 [Mycena galopus ATCC 62051]|nr:hypothetical protein K438DRAFT_1040969 [Mycena galopus ATCC 62051]
MVLRGASSNIIFLSRFIGPCAPCDPAYATCSAHFHFCISRSLPESSASVHLVLGTRRRWKAERSSRGWWCMGKRPVRAASGSLCGALLCRRLPSAWAHSFFLCLIPLFSSFTCLTTSCLSRSLIYPSFFHSLFISPDPSSTLPAPPSTSPPPPLLPWPARHTPNLPSTSATRRLPLPPARRTKCRPTLMAIIKSTATAAAGSTAGAVGTGTSARRQEGRGRIPPTTCVRFRRRCQFRRRSIPRAIRIPSRLLRARRPRARRARLAMPTCPLRPSDAQGPGQAHARQQSTPPPLCCASTRASASSTRSRRTGAARSRRRSRGTVGRRTGTRRR